MATKVVVFPNDLTQRTKVLRHLWYPTCAQDKKERQICLR